MRYPLRGKRVVVQRYGETNRELQAELENEGADITEIVTYRWVLPEDTMPLLRLIDALGRDEIDLVARSTHARAGLCRTWHSPRCCDAWAKEASPSMASARPFTIGVAKKQGVSEATECAAPHSCTPNLGQPISETLRIAERQRNTIHEAVEQIVGPFGCFLIADAEPHNLRHKMIFLDTPLYIVTLSYAGRASFTISR